MIEAEGPVFEYAGLSYRVHKDVYDPHDDTWLLVDEVSRLPLAGKYVLEVGCGTGLGLLAALKRGARGVGSDRNRLAVPLMLENAAINGVRDRVDGVLADLVGPFDPAQFDVVLFNPPYLPTAPGERLEGELNLAFDGGASGDETIHRFLGQLEDWARAELRVPEVLLVVSNLNDVEGLRRRMAAMGLSRQRPSQARRSFFHRLWVEHYSHGDGVEDQVEVEVEVEDGEGEVVGGAHGRPEGLSPGTD